MATKKAKGKTEAKAESKRAREPEAKAERPAWDDRAGIDLKAHREALGLTREQVGLKTGCTGSRIRELERNRTSKGPTHPGRELAERLADFLATPVPEPAEGPEEAATEEPGGLAAEAGEPELVGAAEGAMLGDEAPDPVEA